MSVVGCSSSTCTYIGSEPVLDGSSQGILCFRCVHTGHAKADGSDSFPWSATLSKGSCIETSTFAHRWKQKEKDRYTCWHKSNEKPGNMPDCPIQMETRDC